MNDACIDACLSPDEIADLALAVGIDITPRRPAIDVLEATGWVIAHTGRATIVADIETIGALYMPGHAHADSLTFELWLDDQRAVVDAGVACYQRGALRTWSRSTAVHNTIELDGIDSSEVWSAFRVGRQARARLLRAVAKSGAETSIVAEHDGYAHLPGNPTHRRTFSADTERAGYPG